MNKVFYAPLFLLIVFCFSFNISHAALLQNTNEMENQMSVLSQNAGFDTSTKVGSIVATVIQAFLGLLGIIFVILILTAGYNWMTAAGDEDKVTKAKDTLSRAIIGLIIIVAAYAITYFVINNLPWGTGSGTSSSNNTGSSGTQ